MRRFAPEDLRKLKQAEELLREIEEDYRYVSEAIASDVLLLRKRIRAVRSAGKYMGWRDER